MALKTSTGLRTKLLDDSSLASVLHNGFIDIYAGTTPASADDAIGGATLLCRISVNSGVTGLTFGAAANGTISKNGSEVWSGVNAASGTATFYRHVAPGDTGALSTTAPRIQGTVAIAGGELNLSSVALTSGATQTIDYYSVTLPTL